MLSHKDTIQQWQDFADNQQWDELIQAVAQFANISSNISTEQLSSLKGLQAVFSNFEPTERNYLSVGLLGILSCFEQMPMFKSMKTLDLDGRSIPLNALPESIGNIEHLEDLDLYQNNLSSLPESMRKLTKLRRLSLRQNKFETLPEWIGELTQLEQLNLYSNSLTSIPESIGRLTSLQELQLMSNQIRVIPESIGKLVKLRKLELAGWYAQTLPATFSNLSKLEYLVVDVDALLSVIDSLNHWTHHMVIRTEPNAGVITSAQQKRIEEVLPNCTLKPYMD